MIVLVSITLWAFSRLAALRQRVLRWELQHRRQDIGDGVAGRDAPALLHDVERRNAIRLGHGREIEHVVDVGIDVELGREAQLPDVHELGGAVARDLHADDAAAAGIGDQLEKPRWQPLIWPRAISSNRARPTMAPPKCRRAPCFIESDGGDLGNGVHARGQARHGIRGH